MKKQIYSERVWQNGALSPATVSFENGMITSINREKENTAEDYGRHIIMPGVIDVHVHINEPGRTDWEGFDTGTKAAARGGTTTIVDMPLNSSPVVTDLKAFIDKIKSTEGKRHVNCGFWAGGIGQDLTHVEEMLGAGCLGIKVFMSDSGLEDFPKIEIDDLDALMSLLSNKDIPVLAHCELDTLPADEIDSEKWISYKDYLSSRPKSWENEAITVFVDLCEKYNCKAHIVHLASEEIITWIDQKKKDGLPLTVETCPHYLVFDAEDIKDGDTVLKCAPPIRKKETQSALKKAIVNGTIDFISTDHSPAPPDLKSLDKGDFKSAWGGISGIQFLLSASWTSLKAHTSMEQFIPLLTEKPAAFIRQPDIGKIEIGSRADICIWNPESSFQVTEKIIEHKHKITPYLGRELYGEVIATIVNGQTVFEKDRFVSFDNGRLVLNEMR